MDVLLSKQSPKKWKEIVIRKKKESANREKRMKHETKVFAKPSMSSSQRAGSPRTQKDSYDRKRFFFWQKNTR